MARKKDEEYDEEEAVEEESEDDVEELEDEEDLEPVVSENAIVEVAFGEPEDGLDEEERVLDWVSSFKPGEFQRQVADLFMSDGEVYIMLDKMTVILPMIELFRLLENSGAITDSEGL